MLDQLNILPPEFKGDYLMQARLISGMAGTIDKVIIRPEVYDLWPEVYDLWPW